MSPLGLFQFPTAVKRCLLKCAPVLIFRKSEIVFVVCMMEYITSNETLVYTQVRVKLTSGGLCTG